MQNIFVSKLLIYIWNLTFPINEKAKCSVMSDGGGTTCHILYRLHVKLENFSDFPLFSNFLHSWPPRINHHTDHFQFVFTLRPIWKRAVHPGTKSIDLLVQSDNISLLSVFRRWANNQLWNTIFCSSMILNCSADL